MTLPTTPIPIVVPSDLADLVPGFLKNRHADVASLRQHLVSLDFDSIRRIGHGMKGTGGAYGFDEVTRIGAVLESAANQKNAELVETGVAQLSNYLDRVVLSSSPD